MNFYSVCLLSSIPAWRGSARLQELAQALMNERDAARTERDRLAAENMALREALGEAYAGVGAMMRSPMSDAVAALISRALADPSPAVAGLPALAEDGRKWRMQGVRTSAIKKR